MFNKREAVNFEQVETLIGKNTSFQGRLESKGGVRIDGSLTGEVQTGADMVVGESGYLQANVQVRNLLVAGSLEGNITASGKVEITKTGTVIGDIGVKNLIIEDGGIFKGNCEMEKSNPPQKRSEDQELT